MDVGRVFRDSALGGVPNLGAPAVNNRRPRGPPFFGEGNRFESCCRWGRCRQDPLTRGPNQVQTPVDVALAVFTLNQLDAAPSYKLARRMVAVKHRTGLRASRHREDRYRCSDVSARCTARPPFEAGRDPSRSVCIARLAAVGRRGRHVSLALVARAPRACRSYLHPVTSSDTPVYVHCRAGRRPPPLLTLSSPPSPGTRRSCGRPREERSVVRKL